MCFGISGYAHVSTDPPTDRNPRYAGKRLRVLPKLVHPRFQGLDAVVFAAQGNDVPQLLVRQDQPIMKFTSDGDWIQFLPEGLDIWNGLSREEKKTFKLHDGNLQYFMDPDEYEQLVLNLQAFLAMLYEDITSRCTGLRYLSLCSMIEREDDPSSPLMYSIINSELERLIAVDNIKKMETDVTLWRWMDFQSDYEPRYENSRNYPGVHLHDYAEKSLILQNLANHARPCVRVGKKPGRLRLAVQ